MAGGNVSSTAHTDFKRIGRRKPVQFSEKDAYLSEKYFFVRIGQCSYLMLTGPLWMERYLARANLTVWRPRMPGSKRIGSDARENALYSQVLPLCLSPAEMRPTLFAEGRQAFGGVIGIGGQGAGDAFQGRCAAAINRLLRQLHCDGRVGCDLLGEFGRARIQLLRLAAFRLPDPHSSAFDRRNRHTREDHLLGASACRSAPASAGCRPSRGSRRCRPRG